MAASLCHGGIWVVGRDKKRRGELGQRTRSSSFFREKGLEEEGSELTFSSKITENTSKILSHSAPACLNVAGTQPGRASRRLM